MNSDNTISDYVPNKTRSKSLTTLPNVPNPTINEKEEQQSSEDTLKEPNQPNSCSPLNDIEYVVGEDNINFNKEHKDSNLNPVCRFYKKGTCKHGIKGKNCPFVHPKACQKLLKNGNKGPKGCKDGIRCKFFHPRMCSTSIQRGECFDVACSYAHVKGTKRKQIPKKTESKSESEDFLRIMDNFKSEIMGILQEKFKTNTYHLPPPHPIQQPTNMFQPTNFLQPTMIRNQPFPHSISMCTKIINSQFK